MGAIGARLTDGSGIGTWGASKVVKDFVADLLMGGAAGLAAINVVDIPQDQEQATIVTFALAKALIQAVFRALLKWTQT